MGMTVPVWVLLAFAGWTLVLLIFSVGVYRWTRILTRRVAIGEFQADRLEGHADWYRRAMRAHANCVENLPVYGAVVLVIVVTGVQSPLLDASAVVLICARVAQSLIHLSFEQTNVVTSFRFTFYSIQVICMFAMGGYVTAAALI